MKKTTMSSGGRVMRRLALVCVLVCGLPVLTTATALHAQTKLKPPSERVAQGTVVSDGDTPQDNVVVYLQDTKTQVIRSYVTNNGGQFHFNQLSPDTDYEIWAERNKNRSKKHVISMFSSHTHFTYKLKVD